MYFDERYAKALWTAYVVTLRYQAPWKFQDSKFLLHNPVQAILDMIRNGVFDEWSMVDYTELMSRVQEDAVIWEGRSYATFHDLAVGVILSDYELPKIDDESGYLWARVDVAFDSFYRSRLAVDYKRIYGMYFETMQGLVTKELFGARVSARGYVWNPYNELVSETKHGSLDSLPQDEFVRRLEVLEHRSKCFIRLDEEGLTIDELVRNKMLLTLSDLA